MMKPHRLLWVFCIGWLWLAGQKTHGQCGANVNNLSGSLQVRPSVGCPPHTIQVSNTQAIATNIRYVFMYDGKDESKVTRNTTFTYTSPGLYYVLQLSDADGKPTRACAIVTVQDTIQPQMTHSTCGNKTTISVTAPLPADYDAFRVDWGDGSSEVVTPDQARTMTHTYSTATDHRISVSGQYYPTNCGGTTIKTAIPGITSTPPVIGALVAKNGQLTVPISNPAQLTYYVERRVGNEPYSRATPNINTPTTLQTAFDSTKITCYRVVLTDPCLTNAPQPDVCYTPPPATTITTPPISATTLIPSLSESNWFFPTAFSPNNDGTNDRFSPVGNVLFTAFRLVVFDRWGVAVFDTTDPALGWDGQATNGQPAQSGAYPYRADWEPTNGSHQSLRGSVLLLR
jgi:gliding motility-associated-like protein